MDVEPRGRARADRGQFSLLVRQIRPYWRRFLVAILLGVAASTLSLLQPALIASMVTALENSTGILPSVLLLLALLTTSAALSGFQTYALGTLGEQVTGRIRMTYVRAVLRLPVCALEAYRRADLVARATSDTTLLRVALTEGAGQIIGGVIMFVGALIAMAFVSPLLLLATVVTVTIGLVCVMALSGRLRNASTQVQEGVSSLGSSLDQSIFASKTIRSLNATDWAISRVDRTIDAAKQAGIRFARVSSAVTPLSGVVMQLCLAVVLGLGAFQVANGTLPVAQLVAFVMYVFLLLTPVGQAVRAMTSLSQATAAARRLAEVEGRPRLLRSGQAGERLRRHRFPARHRCRRRMTLAQSNSPTFTSPIRQPEAVRRPASRNRPFAESHSPFRRGRRSGSSGRRARARAPSSISSRVSTRRRRDPSA